MNHTPLAVLLLATAWGCHNPNATVRIAVAQGSLGHMPVALAEALGFYREEGIAVTLELLPGTKTVEALLAGSAEAASGHYEQILQLAAEGRALRSFVLITARDTRALVAAANRNEIRAIADLKGRNVGVAGLGSATQVFATHVLLRHGVKPEEVNFIGIGMGRSGISAIERGVVDAASIASGDFIHIRTKHPHLAVLAESMTPEGSKAVFDSDIYPAMALMAKAEWLSGHPEQARRLARAMKRTLLWLRERPAQEIRAKLPPEYRTDDEVIDLEAIRIMKSIYSADGAMPPESPQVVRKALAATQEKTRLANIDLSTTYTNAFVTEKP